MKPLYIDFFKNTFVEEKDYLENPEKVCRYFDNLEVMEAHKEEFFAFVDNQKNVEYERCLGVDIETSKWDGHDIKKNESPDFKHDRLSIIQVSNGHLTWVFNVNNIPKEDFRPFAEKLAEIPWVGHNIKFDCKFLKRDYKVQPPLVFDTELAAKNIKMEPNRGYNFQAVVKEYMFLHLPKEDQIANWGMMFMTAPMISYAARDAYYSMKLMRVLTNHLNMEERLRTTNTSSAYIHHFGVYHRLFHLEMECVLIFLEMESYGFSLDRATLESNCTFMDGVEKDYLTNLIKDLGYRSFNPRSPQQILKLFAREYPEAGRFNEEGKFIFLKDLENVDKDHLKPFIKIGLPLVDRIFEFKSLTGQIQRLEEFETLIDEYDRIYPDFRVWGTVTGRTSCKKPNLQNIKNLKGAKGNTINLKNIFKAPFGKKLIVVDFSQIQLVIIAAMTQDPVMMDVIINGPNKKLPLHPGGMDLHLATAAAVLGKPIEEVTKSERSSAKPVNFGYCFGMGWRSFIDYAWLQYDTRFTEDTAKTARKSFFNLYKGIDKWHKEVLASARGGRYYCRSLYGRDILALKFTDATNYPVQAAEALIMKLSLVLIKNELVKKGLYDNAHLVNIVHDEVVYETDAFVSDEVFEIICRNMSEAGRVVLKGVLPVRVEGHIVDRWSEAK